MESGTVRNRHPALGPPVDNSFNEILSGPKPVIDSGDAGV